MADQTQDPPGASGALPPWWANVPKPLQHGTGEYQPPGYPTTTAFGVPTRFVPGPLNSGQLNQALDELQGQIAGFVAEAPQDGAVYGRSNAAWSQALPVTALGTTVPAMDGVGAAGSASTVARADHVHPTDTSRAAASAIPAASSTAPAMDGTATAGSATAYARGDHVHPTDTSRAALASPIFTGVPVAPTAAPATNTTQLATTAFVSAAISAGSTGTITSITAGAGLTGGNITTTGTIALATPVSVANGGTGTPSPGLVAGTNVTISGSWPNQTINSTGGAGQLPVYQPADVATTTGTAVSITAGTTTNAAGTGGSLTLAAGQATVSAAMGGGVIINSGLGATGSGTLTVQSPNGTGPSGSVILKTGNSSSGSSSSGAIQLTTGTANGAGSPGNISLTAADAQNLGLGINGASITLKSGAGGTGNGLGGDIKLTTGVGSGTGRRGVFTVSTLPTTDPAITDALWSSGGYVMVSGQTPANNVGRNLLHNPLFNIQQRGVGPFTTNLAYTVDRWQEVISGGTLSISRANLSDADRAGIGDEAAAYCLSSTITGSAAAGDYMIAQQAIENVRRLAGKTVTVSFWANANAALKLGVNLRQTFGTGGSPSGDLWALSTGASVTIPGTTFARYSTSIAIPSTTGKTIGTSSNDATLLTFWLSSGSSNNALAGNIGVQSGVMNLWGVQLEIGSVATPLEKPDPQQDLATCQRFYQTGLLNSAGYGSAGVAAFSQLNFATTMRATPTVTPAYTTQTNCSGSTVLGAGTSVNGVAAYTLVTATGAFTLQGSYTASADL